MFKVVSKIYKNYNEDWDSKEQIIVCSSGVFKKVKVNSICFITKKTSFANLDIDPKNISFDKRNNEDIFLEEKPYFKKRIPKELLDTILKFYQVYAKNNLEAKLNIWYNKLTEEFFIDCPFQVNGVAHVTEIGFDHPNIIWTDELKERFPEKWNLKQLKKDRAIEKIIETHSHHSTTR